MKKLHCYFFTDDELHAEYAWAWVLHNLARFLHPYPVPLLDDGSGDEVHCTT
jgi:hypothetical protein